VTLPQEAAETPPSDLHFEWHTFETEAELRHAQFFKARSRGFKTPAAVAVLVLSPGARGRDGSGVVGAAGSEIEKSPTTAYLSIAVNHAMSDAPCVVPLVADLLALHKAALQTSVVAPTASPLAHGLRAAAAEALARAKLPPLPHSLELQRERLKKTLSKHGLGGADDSLDLGQDAFREGRRGYDHYIRMLPGACKLLEIGAEVVGVPSDHLLVVALAVAFGRVAEFFDEVKVTLIVPTRDERGEGHVIANLSNTRHLRIALRKRSLFAVALDLSGRLRRREWELCDFLRDDGDLLFINVRSLPPMEGAQPQIETVDTSRVVTSIVRNMIEMFADQERADQWTFTMGIRNDLDGRPSQIPSGEYCGRLPPIHSALLGAFNDRWSGTLC
jgi:hypothetical protein